jgi:hypothetical protein
MKKLFAYGFLSILVLGHFLTPVFAQPNNEEYKMAVEVAKRTADRNLIERLFGVWIISESEVKDFQLKRDIVITKATGQLFGVKYSDVREDRRNGLLVVNAGVSKEDALTILKKSGYKGGGELEEYIQARGESAYSGPWGKTTTPVRTNYYERELSLATCMTFILFNELSLTPPSDLAQWNTLVREVDVNATTTLSRDMEGRVRLDMKLKRDHISYILKRAKEEGIISSAEQKSAEGSFSMLGYDKGLVASCFLKDGRVIKPSSGEARFLNLNNDMSCALTEHILKIPTADMPSTVAKYSKVTFNYSDSDKELHLELFLDKADVPFALAYLDGSESDKIISRIGKGIKLAVDVYGR